MRIRNLLMIGLMGAVLTLQAQEYQSFASFAEYFEKETGIELFYKDEWVANIRVSISEDSINAMDAMRAVIENAGLNMR